MGNPKNLAVAYGTQRAARKKKMARGISSQDSNTTPKTSEQEAPTAKEETKSRQMLDKEHDRDECRGEDCPGCMSPDCYAYGGVVGGQAPGQTQDGAPSLKPAYGHLGAGSDMAPKTGESPMEDKYQRMAKQSLEESAGYQGIADRIRSRRMMAEGGVVGKDNDDDYKFDSQDQIEHPNYYYARDEIAGNEKLYDNDYGTDPRDSNEKGDRLDDEDENSKSMFKRIKMKKAQPGDRG